MMAMVAKVQPVTFYMFTSSFSVCIGRRFRHNTSYETVHIQKFWSRRSDNLIRFATKKCQSVMSRLDLPDFTGAVVGGGEYTVGNLLRNLSTEHSYIYEADGSDEEKYVFKWIRPRVDGAIEREVRMNHILAGVPFAATAVRIITDPIEAHGTAALVMKRFSMDLLDFINASGSVDEDRVVRWSLDVLLCLIHLHARGIVHRDIKLENIFLNLEQDQAYLGDFGLSEHLADGEYFRDIVGTKQYSAPELLSSDRYNKSVDLWAFGVVVYTMLTGRYPFPSYQRENSCLFYEAVMSANYDREALSDCSEPACQLVEHLLVVNPEQRWTCEDLRWCEFYREAEDPDNAGPRLSGAIGGAMSAAEKS
jgi:serine/threonine protein kinase